MDLEDTRNSRDLGEKPSFAVPSIQFNSEFSSRTKSSVPRRPTIVPPTVEMPVCTGAEWQTNCLVISGIPFRTPILAVQADLAHILATYKVAGDYQISSTNKFLLDANLVYSVVVRLSSHISTTISLDMASGISRPPDPSENRGVLPVTNHYHVSFLQESESIVLSDGTVIGEVKGVAGNRDQQNLQIAGLKAWLQSQGVVCACIATVARVYVPSATIRKCFSVPLLRLVARSATAHSMVQRLGLRRLRFRLLDLGPFCYEFFQSISILRVLAVPGESLTRQGEWLTALTSASTTPREVHLSLVSDGVRPRAVFCRKVKAETEYWISLESKPDTECTTLRQTKELLGCTPTLGEQHTPGQAEIAKTRTTWLSYLHGQDPWVTAARNIAWGSRVPQRHVPSSQGSWAGVAAPSSTAPPSAPPASLPSPPPSSAALEARVASLEKEVARLQATLDALSSAPTLTSPSSTSSAACASIHPPATSTASSLPSSITTVPSGGTMAGALPTQPNIPTVVNSSVQILAPTLVPSTIVAKMSRPPPNSISTTAPSASRNPAHSAPSRGGLLEYFTSERKSVPSTLPSTVSSAITLAAPTRSSVTFPTPSDTMWSPVSEPVLPSPGETTPQKRPRTASLSPEVVHQWASPVKLDILDDLPVVERSNIVSVRESTFLALDAVTGLYEVPIGRGLFAASDITAGAAICEFKGTLLTRKEHETRYPDNDSQYTICLSKDLFLDCVDNAGAPDDLSPVCLASCANDARHVRLANGVTPKPNAELTLHLRRAFLKARKPIKAGEEISYSYGNRFRIIPPSKSAKDSDEERLYNRLLLKALPMSNGGRLQFTVELRGTRIEVDIQLSQLCKLLRRHAFTFAEGQPAQEQAATDMVFDLPCILRRRVTQSEWKTITSSDYYLAETDGFCQFQTVIMLEAKDHQLFHRKTCNRAEMYKAFFDRLTEPLQAIIQGIKDGKVQSDLQQEVTRCRPVIDQAVLEKITKPTLTPYPFLELGFCMAQAIKLNTATFTVDTSSPSDWLPLTGLSMYPEHREFFTIKQLLLLPSCQHVGSTGVHIHPITIWTPLTEPHIMQLATLMRQQLAIHLEALGLLTPDLDS